MTIASFLLVFFAFALGITISLISPYIRKVTNCYFFWAGISIILIIYEIYFRFGNDFSKAFAAIDNKNTTDTIVFSKGFLLDLCPFTGLFIPVFLILDPTRRLAASLAPFAIFGGIITLVCQIMTNSDGDVEFSTKYIFEGIQPNPIYYMLHVINLVLGMFVLANVPSMKFKGAMYCCVFILLYFMYVIVMINIFKVDYNVTGLTGNDWINGEYSSVSNVLNLPFPTVMYVGYIAITLFIVGVVVLQSFINSRKHFKITYAPKKFIDIYKLSNLLNTYECVCDKIQKKHK